MRAWMPFRLPLAIGPCAWLRASTLFMPVSCALRKGGGLVDAPGRGLLGAKSGPFEALLPGGNTRK